MVKRAMLVQEENQVFQVNLVFQAQLARKAIEGLLEIKVIRVKQVYLA
jgi:hypothetical protein